MIQPIARLLCCMLCWGISIEAQTQVDLRTQSKFVDFQNAQSTRPLKTGTVLPATCNQGEMYFLTTAAPGANIYGCAAANTWIAQSGGGAGSTTIQNTGTVVGLRPILNLSTGPGVVQAISDTGQTIAIQSSLDTAFVETRASDQSGASLLCNSASGSATTYTCALSPTLTTYTAGMVLHWKPDVNSTGVPVTLNVDTLGAVSVKLADGISNPAAGDLVAGQTLEMGYDGTIFRILNSRSAAGQLGTSLFCNSSSGSAIIYTCAMSPTLTSYVTGTILHWKPDLSGTGGATTLNVDALGATPLKLADGTTDPAPGDLVAGRFQEVWYDGSVFRILYPKVLSGALGEAQPACSVAVRGRLWFVAGATGIQDGLTVCAKDATNSYAWRTLY